MGFSHINQTEQLELRIIVKMGFFYALLQNFLFNEIL